MRKRHSHIKKRCTKGLKKDIVGHWKGAQQFDEKWSGEWEDIPYGGWSQEYIFNSDGTFTDIHSFRLPYKGTYSILKNEDYAKNTTKCELFLIITTDMYSYGRKQAIWMEDKYLRIVPQNSGIPATNIVEVKLPFVTKRIVQN